MAGEGCGRRKAKRSPRNELHSHIFQADRAVANHNCAGIPNSSGETAPSGRGEIPAGADIPDIPDIAEGCALCSGIKCNQNESLGHSVLTLTPRRTLLLRPWRSFQN